MKRLLSGRSTINQIHDHKVITSVHSLHGWPFMFYRLDTALRQSDARNLFPMAAFAAPSSRVISHLAV
jgi:hypothetical protein